MGAIYRREMGAFFTSGVAYVFLVVFYFVSGIFFYNYVLAAGVDQYRVGSRLACDATNRASPQWLHRGPATPVH